jgi:predicted ArsR family transcriptional regulator
MFYRRAYKAYELLDSTWRTTKDIALELRCSITGARNILNFLVKKGLVEEAWKRAPLSGRWVKVYRRKESVSGREKIKVVKRGVGVNEHR